MFIELKGKFYGPETTLSLKCFTRIHGAIIKIFIFFILTTKFKLMNFIYILAKTSS